jgi:hypothetical protein
VGKLPINREYFCIPCHVTYALNQLQTTFNTTFESAHCVIVVNCCTHSVNETSGTRLYEEIIEHGRNLSITSRPRHKLHGIMSLYLLMASGTTSDNFIFYVAVSCLPLPDKAKRKKQNIKNASNDQSLFLVIHRFSKLKKGISLFFKAVEGNFCTLRCY